MNRLVAITRRLITLSQRRGVGLAATSALSLTAWLVVSQHHLVLAYNDAMSHLNIARRVVDNLQPGLAQVGTVWLPLNHLLYLPLIWNNWAWQTGFAGSLTSMVAYVLGVAGVYCTVKLLTGARLPAFVGAAAFGLNLNLLYLQATPLTETLYLTLLIWSIYCFVAYVRSEDPRYLISLGALGFLQVLTRYDGWFVVGVQSVLLLVHELRRGRIWHEAAGRVIVMAAPAAFAIALWLLWNASFGNPFYFATGDGSAKAQQDVIAAGSGLIAKGHLPIALWLYFHAAVDNIGLQVVVIGLVGTCYLLLSPSPRLAKVSPWIIVALLAAPVAFNVLALYLGFSTISLPELGTALNDRGQWFNVRYGIIALPALAIVFGIFARLSRPVALALLAVVVLQGAVLWQNGLITIADGTRGASAFTDADVATHLAHDVHPGEHILMSFSQFSPVSLSSGPPLSQYVHEGVERSWKPALDDPARYAQWIVIARGDVGDPVYTALRKQHHNDFEQTFHLVYTGEHAAIYERNADVATSSP